MLAETVIFSNTENIPLDVLALSERLGIQVLRDRADIPTGVPVLCVSDDGLCLESDGKQMRCDLASVLPRLKTQNLRSEMLLRAAKIKCEGRAPIAIDATAGLGEDSLLLAAGGFEVKMYERNPIIALLLKDAVSRARLDPLLSDAVSRMEVIEGDSITALHTLGYIPDVVYLDPMFPEKEKSALAKKKFQLLHLLELPCSDEEELLSAAMAASPHKIVIKRPLKGPYLCEKKPSFSLAGKAIRYDCIVLA